MKKHELRWNWNRSDIIENKHQHVRVQRIINEVNDIMFERRLIQSDCMHTNTCGFYKDNTSI